MNIDKVSLKKNYHLLIDYLSKRSLIVLLTLILLILCYFCDYNTSNGFFIISYTLIIMFGFYFFNKNIELKNKKDENKIFNYLFHKFICSFILLILIIVIHLLDTKLFIENRYLAYIFISLFTFYGFNKLIYR